MEPNARTKIHNLPWGVYIAPLKGTGYVTSLKPLVAYLRDVHWGTPWCWFRSVESRIARLLCKRSLIGWLIGEKKCITNARYFSSHWKVDEYSGWKRLKQEYMTWKKARAMPTPEPVEEKEQAAPVGTVQKSFSEHQLRNCVVFFVQWRSVQRLGPCTIPLLLMFAGHCFGHSWVTGKYFLVENCIWG